MTLTPGKGIPLSSLIVPETVFCANIKELQKSEISNKKCNFVFIFNVLDFL